MMYLIPWTGRPRPNRPRAARIPVLVLDRVAGTDRASDSGILDGVARTDIASDERLLIMMVVIANLMSSHPPGYSTSSDKGSIATEMMLIMMSVAHGWM